MIDPVEFGKQMAAIVREVTSPLLKRIDELEKALANIPTPKYGQSVTLDDVRPMLEAMVADAVKALPPPKDGKDGKDADMDQLKSRLADLVKSVPVPSVDEVAARFERRFSDLALSWERQARDTFERAADRMPIPKDGRDALPLESFDLSLDEDGRTVTVKMQASDTVVEKSLRIASVIDRGPFRGDGQYEKGDAVSHGGCLWIAQEDNPGGAPGLGGKGWRLAVKKGRDGKDLRENASIADSSKGVSAK